MSYLSTNSKGVTSEQKKITLNAIIEAGEKGITSEELQKLNGLTSKQMNGFMQRLKHAVGGIRSTSDGKHRIWRTVS